MPSVDDDVALVVEGIGEYGLASEVEPGLLDDLLDERAMYKRQALWGGVVTLGREREPDVTGGRRRIPTPFATFELEHEVVD